MKRWRTDGSAPRNVAAALALLVAVIAVNTGRAESPLPVAKGFSPEGLTRIGDYVRNEITSGKIPGAVLLIQQHGQPVFFESFGMRDVDTKRPMTIDTIFRLYSMSKAITSVATVMLVEDGKLRLDDPVSKYIPPFAEVKVAVDRRVPLGRRRRHLLFHRSEGRYVRDLHDAVAIATRTNSNGAEGADLPGAEEVRAE